MKRLVTYIFCCLSFALFAQTTQESKPQINLHKKWLVGGNGEIYMERIGSSQGRVIAIIEPQAGYFFTKNFSAGIRLPMQFKSTEYGFDLHPFFRYYFSVSGKLVPFVEANLGYGWRYVSDVSNDYSVTQGIRTGARAGGAYFLNPNVSLDVFLYYQYQKGNTVYPNGKTGTTANQYLGVGFGFQVYL